jgi:hypothetical protein
MYNRVVPRDLFNEAKLLKCLGQLVLLIHDGNAPPKLTYNNTGDAFNVYQRPHDGGLYCCNPNFQVNGKQLTIYSGYNDKSPYPLFCATSNTDSYEEMVVFNDDGTLADEFTAYIDTL